MVWKVGEEVAVKIRGEVDTIAPIERVTPSGRALVHHCWYNANGMLRTRDRWHWGSIEKPTDADKAHVRRSKALRQFERIKPKELPIEALEAILAIAKAERRNNHDL